ncbi:MAG TPA: DMT family transporter, partial [Phaeodactylibacter sp.]|nr:DMT family transporter [Phaeodactylibacter sp.]
WYLFIVGFAGSALPGFLFAIAQTEVSSSVAGVLNSLTPFFVLIQGVLFYELILTKEKALGVILGLAGASVLIIFGNMGEGTVVEGNQWYALFLVLATCSYALSANTIQKHLQDISAINLSAAAYCIVAPLGLGYLFFTDFINTFNTHPDSMTSLGAVVVLSLASTVIASVIFFKLVQMTSALFASMVAYFIPLVALLFGIYDGEKIMLYHFIGMAMILFGVYITKKK